jgi:hypothetical protein
LQSFVRRRPRPPARSPVRRPIVHPRLHRTAGDSRPSWQRFNLVVETRTHACMHTCRHACTHACMHARMHARTHTRGVYTRAHAATAGRGFTAIGNSYRERESPKAALKRADHLRRTVLPCASHTVDVLCCDRCSQAHSLAQRSFGTLCAKRVRHHTRARRGAARCGAVAPVVPPLYCGVSTNRSARDSRCRWSATSTRPVSATAARQAAPQAAPHSCAITRPTAVGRVPTPAGRHLRRTGSPAQARHLPTLVADASLSAAHRQAATAPAEPERPLWQLSLLHNRSPAGLRLSAIVTSSGRAHRIG